MAAISKKKNGTYIVDTIIRGRPISIYLGLSVSKIASESWLRSYKMVVMGLTASQKLALSPSSIKSLVERVMLLPKESQIQVATTGLAAMERLEDTFSIDALITEFIEWQKVVLPSSKAQQRNREAYMEIIRMFLDSCDVATFSQITNEVVAGYVAWRSTYRRDTDKRDKKTVAASSIRHEIHQFKKMVDWAVATKDLPDRKAFFGVEVPSTEANTKTIEPISGTDMTLLFTELRKIEDWRFHDLALLAYLTGAEIKAVQWIIDTYPACVDRGTGMIRVFMRQVSGHSGGKTAARGRDIEITPTIREIFLRRKIFGPRKKYLVKNYIANFFKRKWATKHSWDWHFHQLRHSFASHHLSAGYPLEAVSSMLGHADIDTTKNVYGKFLPVDGKRGYEGMRESYKKILDDFHERYFTEMVARKH